MVKKYKTIYANVITRGIDAGLLTIDDVSKATISTTINTPLGWLEALEKAAGIHIEIEADSPEEINGDTILYMFKDDTASSCNSIW